MVRIRVMIDVIELKIDVSFIFKEKPCLEKSNNSLKWKVILMRFYTVPLIFYDLYFATWISYRVETKVFVYTWRFVFFGCYELSHFTTITCPCIHSNYIEFATSLNARLVINILHIFGKCPDIWHAKDRRSPVSVTLSYCVDLSIVDS